MKIKLKGDLVKITITRSQADAVRACLYREGTYPSSPAVQEFRSTLFELLDSGKYSTRAKQTTEQDI